MAMTSVMNILVNQSIHKDMCFYASSYWDREHKLKKQNKKTLYLTFELFCTQTKTDEQHQSLARSPWVTFRFVCSRVLPGKTEDLAKDGGMCGVSKGSTGCAKAEFDKSECGWGIVVDNSRLIHRQHGEFLRTVGKFFVIRHKWRELWEEIFLFSLFFQEKKQKTKLGMRWIREGMYT